MKKVLVIVGPTGVGKTKMSIELAKIFNGEIINADSTQVYIGLDIATAKVTDSEKHNIPHHLFDIKDISEDYTVYDYQKDCRNKIEEITSRNKFPILVGGTGLYVNAALYNYDFSINDTHTDKKLLYDALFIGLTTDREILYEKINNRVDSMIDVGLLEEAKKVLETGIRTKAVMSPIGYKELFPFLKNDDTLENCLNKLKQNSRNYAKKQYTWFNNQTDTKWFDVDFNNFDKTIKTVKKYIDKWKEDKK